MRQESRISLSRFPWFVRLFGLMFLLVGMYGVFAMLFGIGNITITVNDGPARPATPADAWLPGIFVLVGLGIALIRYGVVIDASRRMRIKTIGWALWVKRTETSLVGMTSIELGSAEERGSGSGRYTAIPVRAVGPDGVEELAEPRTFVAARALARRIAEALGIPLGPAQADGLSASIAQADADDLRPPAATRVLLIDAMRGIEIRYPRVKASLVMVIMGGVLPLLLFGGFWWFAWRPGLLEPASKSTFMWFFMMAPILMGLIPALTMLIKGYRSGVFGGRILVDAETGLRCAGRTIAAKDLRAIEVMPGNRWQGGLRVVLETSEFTLCPGQEAADLRWIRALILRHLNGKIR